MDQPDLDAFLTKRDKLKALELDAERLTRRILGADELDALVARMLDLEFEPAHIRTRVPPPIDCVAHALANLDQAIGTLDPAQAQVIEDAAAAAHTSGRPSASLLTLATQRSCCAIPDALLQGPELNSPAFQAEPKLAERLDNRGLVDLTDLEAVPDALFFGGHALAYHQLLRRSFVWFVNYVLNSDTPSPTTTPRHAALVVSGRAAEVPATERDH